MKRFLLIGEDTCIATKDGYKYVDELKEGDQVLAEDGNLALVTDVTPAPKFNLETLTVNYYDFLSIAGIHTLTAINEGTGRCEEIKVEDLISGEPYLAESSKSLGQTLKIGFKEQVYKLLEYLFTPGEEFPYLGGVISPEFFEHFLDKISKPVECKEGYRLIVSNSETYIEGIKHLLDTFGYTIEYTSTTTDALKEMGRADEIEEYDESYGLVYRENENGLKRIFRLMDEEGYKDIDLYKKHISPYIVKLEQVRPERVLLSHGLLRVNTLDEKELEDFLGNEDNNNDDIDWKEIDEEDDDIDWVNNDPRNSEEDYRDTLDNEDVYQIDDDNDDDIFDDEGKLKDGYYDLSFANLYDDLDDDDYDDDDYDDDDYDDSDIGVRVYRDDDCDEELDYVAFDMSNEEDMQEFMSLMENMFNSNKEEPKKEHTCECSCDCKKPKEDKKTSMNASKVKDEDKVKMDAEFNKSDPLISALDQLIDVLNDLKEERGK